MGALLAPLRSTSLDKRFFGGITNLSISTTARRMLRILWLWINLQIGLLKKEPGWEASRRILDPSRERTAFNSMIRPSRALLIGGSGVASHLYRTRDNVIHVGHSPLRLPWRAHTMPHTGSFSNILSKWWRTVASGTIAVVETPGANMVAAFIVL